MEAYVLRWLCVFVFCLPCLQKASAQDYRVLTADDFRGEPGSGEDGVIAYTNCSIDFRYTAHPQRGYYLLNFTIRMVMNSDKSWMDKDKITSPDMLAEVLKHEHYIIAYLEQQELLRTVSKTVFHADYAYEAQQLFDRIDAKYKQLNSDYDEDTQHMVNRVQQASWDMYFKKQLGDMYIND